MKRIIAVLAFVFAALFVPVQAQAEEPTDCQTQLDMVNARLVVLTDNYTQLTDEYNMQVERNRVLTGYYFKMNQVNAKLVAENGELSHRVNHQKMTIVKLRKVIKELRDQ